MAPESVAAASPAQGLAEMSRTIEELRDRGLYSGAAWLIELRESISADASGLDQSANGASGKGMKVWPPAAEPARASTTDVSARFATARSYFELREYARCAHALDAVYRGDAKATFLRYYAQLFVRQRCAVEDDEAVLGMNSEPKSADPKITELCDELEELAAECGTDTYLDHLRGLYHRELRNDAAAAEAFVRSVSRNAYNWPSWKELVAICNNATEVSRIVASLPDSDMVHIFRVLALTELHKSDDSIDNQLNELSETYPANDFIKLVLAIRCYTVQDFEEAEQLFDGVYKRDPYRLDYIDVYSNVLFVLERRAKLSYLSKRLMAIDRHRAETCCVVGNYYSLLGEHDLAVQHFRKALQLDRRYTPAWTLMGHEYVEMKNTHAAIESYRSAVDYDRRDYRAWFGLGQTYEMLEMHYYALHYFERAAALKPYDSRMWDAIAGCYDRLGRYAEAIRALKRALAPALDKVDAMDLDRDASASLRESPPSAGVPALGGIRPTGPTAALAAVADAGVDPHYLVRLGGLCEKVGDVEGARRNYRLAVAVALRGPGGGGGAEGPLVSPSATTAAMATSPVPPSSIDVSASRLSHLNGLALSSAAVSGDFGHAHRQDVGSRGAASVGASDRDDVHNGGGGGGDAMTVEVAEACLWLARNAIKRSDLHAAERFAGFVGHLEDGRNLLKHVRAMGKRQQV